MIFEKSAGIIIFRKNRALKYLLLNYPSSVRTENKYWGFTKGRIEPGEKELDAAKREAEEETGIKDLERDKLFF